MLRQRIEETRNILDGLEKTLEKIDGDIEETDRVVQAADKNTTAIRKAIEEALEDTQVCTNYDLLHTNNSYSKNYTVTLKTIQFMK